VHLPWANKKGLLGNEKFVILRANSAKLNYKLEESRFKMGFFELNSAS